jgi:hypothetical protein
MNNLGKPSIGNPIPDRYKGTVEDLDRRVSNLEKLNNVVPNIPTHFEKSNTDVIEHNGYLIKRDLSLGLYSILDAQGKAVSRLSEGTFNQLQKARDAVDLYVSGQRLVENRQSIKDVFNPELK